MTVNLLVMLLSFIVGGFVFYRMNTLKEGGEFKYRKYLLSRSFITYIQACWLPFGLVYFATDAGTIPNIIVISIIFLIAGFTGCAIAYKHIMEDVNSGGEEVTPPSVEGRIKKFMDDNKK